MPNQENLYYKLKLEIDGLNDFLSKLKTAKGEISSSFSGTGKSGGAGYSEPSSSQTPIVQSAQNAIDTFQNNPKIKTDLEKINNLIGGLGLINDPQAKRSMINQIRNHYQSLTTEVVGATREMNSILESKGLSASERGFAISKAAAPSIEAMNGAEDVIKEDIISKNPHARNQMRSIGMYLVTGLIANMISQIGSYMGAATMIGAQNLQTTGMAFNFNSLLGNIQSSSQAGMTNEMRNAELQKQKSIMSGTTIGGAVGLGVGAVLSPFTGGLSLPIAGMLGTAIGSTIGNLQGTKDVAELMKKQLPEMEMNQAVGQFMQLAAVREQAWTGLDITKTKFRARNPGDNIAGRGYGYNDEQLYQLGLQQSGITGQYNKDTFQSQLAFSRAHGYNPEDIFAASVSTRYTGQEVGAQQLGVRQGIANMTGMGNRMPELISAMNNLSVMMTKAGVQPTEHGMTEMSMLPFALWGNTARGRMGDLGMETISSLQGMFNHQTGSPEDVFLYNALRKQTKGNMFEFEIAKQKGIMDPENLKSVFRSGQEYAKGDPNYTKNLLNTLMGGNNAIAAENIYNKAYKYKGEEGEGIEGFIKHLESLSGDAEEQKKFLAELDSEAKKNTSGSEKFYASFQNGYAYPGGQFAKDFRELLKTEQKLQNDLVTDKKSWEDVNKYYASEHETFLEKFRKIADAYISQITNGKQTELGFTQGEKDFLWNYTRRGLEDEKYNDAMKWINKGIKEGKITEYIGTQRSATDGISLPKYNEKTGLYDTQSWYLINKGIEIDEQGNMLITKDNNEQLEMGQYIQKDFQTRRQDIEESIKETQREMNDFNRNQKKKNNFIPSPIPGKESQKKGQGDRDFIPSPIPERESPARTDLSKFAQPSQEIYRENISSYRDPRFKDERTINLNITLDASALSSIDSALAKVKAKIIETVTKSSSAQESASIGME